VRCAVQLVFAVSLGWVRRLLSGAVRETIADLAGREEYYYELL
jgi:hypothetical protein